MNLLKYNSATGTSNTLECAVLKKIYPKYDKATHSMVCHPESYGVELIDAAQELLVSTFGPGPGLCEDVRKRKRSKRTEHRRLNHRYYFRLDDETAKAFDALISDSGYETVQGFIESLIKALASERVTV